jgi:hypothetical protein
MRRQQARQAWDPARNILETDLGNGWMTIETFVPQGGRRVVASLTVCPAPPSGPVRPKRVIGEPPVDAVVPPSGITARLLRRVRVGQSAAFVVADYRRWVRAQFGTDALKRLDAHAGRPVQRRKSRRVRRASDAFYAQLSADYVALLEQSVKAPTAELATLRGVPIEQMRSHIHLCRRGGFLTDTVRGKSGGSLTPKAHRVLADSKKGTDS